MTKKLTKVGSILILLFIGVTTAGCVVVVTTQMGSNNNVRKEHDLSEAAIVKDYAVDLKIKNKK